MVLNNATTACPAQARRHFRLRCNPTNQHTCRETGQGLAHAFVEMHDHVNHGAYANGRHTPNIAASGNSKLTAKHDLVSCQITHPSQGTPSQGGCGPHPGFHLGIVFGHLFSPTTVMTRVPAMRHSRRASHGSAIDLAKPRRGRQVTSQTAPSTSPPGCLPTRTIPTLSTKSHNADDFSAIARTSPPPMIESLHGNGPQYPKKAEQTPSQHRQHPIRRSLKTCQKKREERAESRRRV